MSTAQAPPPQRLVLADVSWQTYGRFRRILEGRRSVRLTYDRGELEIMTITHEHESHGRFLGRMVIALTEELGLPIKEGGSTTFRRKRKRRGLEPDNCFWITKEPLVRGKLKIDLRTDPPPDLAIEVDITHSSLDRMGIYAALGVSEVWHFDGQTLRFYHLGAGRRYAVVPSSRIFPHVTPADLAGFLPLRTQMDENAVIRQFRAWVRQRHPAGGSTQPSP
jgi:Uma2 family endonuclease